MKVTSSPATVRMPKIAPAAAPAPAAPRSWMPRPAYVAMICVLSLTLGLGTVRFFSLPAPSNNEADLADLTQFESESPNFDSLEQRANRSSPSVLGERPSSRPTADSAAWLIGTIESEDHAEPIARPPRVTQTSAGAPAPRSPARRTSARGPALVTH